MVPSFGGANFRIVLGYLSTNFSPDFRELQVIQ